MHAMQEYNGAQRNEQHSSIGSYDNGGSAIPRKTAHPQMRDTVGTVGGMLLPLLTQFGHHH